MSWLLIALLAADLASIRQEPNLERRSELALANADHSLTTARKAYDAGDIDKTKEAIEEMQASVELANDSLRETGKDARKKPKFFKQAELNTRKLLRRIDAFREAMGYQYRPLIQPAEDRVNEIHEALLTGIMGKSKNK
ncbi:MAG: hypothetical protein ABL967_15430 [Bryobacteraceae bacterium]